MLDIVDAAEVERPHDDAAVRDPQPHTLARKLVAFEEFLQGRRERLRVAELAAADDAGLELLPRPLDELRNAVFVDPRRRELRAADLQSGYALELLRGGRALLRV